LKLYLKNFLPRTLFGRSFLIILLPVLLVQIITVFFFFDRHWSVVTRRLSSAVAGEIATVAEEVERTPNIAALDDLLSRQSDTLDMRISYTPGGHPTMEKNSTSTLNPQVVQNLDNAMAELVGRPFTINVYQQGQWVGIDVQLKNGMLRTMVPERRLFTRATYIFLLWMLGSSIVLSGVALLFMRNQIRSIRRLAHAAESFGKGRDVARFKPEGAQEVRQAAIAFLDMRDRIRRQMTQRTAMLAGVSHDLRTPLTRMRLQLALMGDTPDTEALRGDLTDMEGMVEGYLAFARGEEEEVAAETDIAALVEDAVSGVKRSEGSISLVLEARPKLTVRRMTLKRCLTNLLENARRHADHIHVTVRFAGADIEIVIDDDGPGIAPENRADVFRPFYRLEESRNQDTGGSGLGLPIARDIARSHGGDVVLDASPQGGLRAIVRLPA
jgi:two-component system osmolarity sensor histidine kinase EnvZ